MPSSFMNRHSGKVVKIAGKLERCAVTELDITYLHSTNQDILFRPAGSTDLYALKAHAFREHFFMLRPIPGDVLLWMKRLCVVDEVIPAEGACLLTSCAKKEQFKVTLPIISDQYEILTNEAWLLLKSGAVSEIKSMLPEIERINVDGYNNIPLSLIRTVTKYPIERIEKQEAFYATILPQQNR